MTAKEQRKEERRKSLKRESNKASKSSITARKEALLKLLEEIGKSTYDQLDSGKFPEFVFPSRSVSNIVYYSSQAYNMEFVDQAESDEIITDLEVLLSRPREDFRVYPEERSAIFGDLTIEYTVPGYEGKRLNFSSHPDGYQIGPSLSTAEFVDTSAEMVIAVEKGGIFTRFVEEKVHEKYKAILIDTAGQPPRSTRFMLNRLNRELNLPVYIMTDGDVYGEHIAMVIISGSANAAHLRDLTVPSAKWMGVWASDIIKYKLPTDQMTEADIKRAQELKKDPRYTGGVWQRELDIYLKMKRKSELEAFSKYGLPFIVDNYLKEKMQEAKSM